VIHCRARRLNSVFQFCL